jgi:hypothetical protein
LQIYPEDSSYLPPIGELGHHHLTSHFPAEHLYGFSLTLDLTPLEEELTSPPEGEEVVSAAFEGEV